MLSPFALPRLRLAEPQHRPPALARPSVVLVPVRKFCRSVVDTLTLHFSFISTGSGVPFPGCFLHGFMGPIPWLFSLLFIILQLIDLRVHEVFDADPHVVRYFWWHHYSHLCLFGADHCMSLLRLCIHLDCRR